MTGSEHSDAPSGGASIREVYKLLSDVRDEVLQVLGKVEERQIRGDAVLAEQAMHIGRLESKLESHEELPGHAEGMLELARLRSQLDGIAALAKVAAAGVGVVAAGLINHAIRHGFQF